MLATVIEALARPGDFFAGRADPRLRWPSLVVAGAGALQGVVGLVLVLQFRALAPDGTLLAVGAAMVPLMVLLGLLAWLLLAGALYVTSYPVGGRGGGRALLAYVGWGWLPQMLGAFVLVAAAVLVVTQLDPPTDEAAAREFGRQVDRRPLVALASAAGTARATATGSFSQVQTAVGVGAGLWSGYVWTAALRHARGLTRRQALLAVAVPVALFVLA